MYRPDWISYSPTWVEWSLTMAGVSVFAMLFMLDFENCSDYFNIGNAGER